MTTNPATSNRAATTLAFLALLISILSFVWVALDKVFPGSVLATRVSLQNQNDSTRFTVTLKDDLPAALITFESGARVRIEAQTVDAMPCITLSRSDTGDVGTFRCVFPATSPPVLQQLDAKGTLLWSAPPAPQEP